MFVICRMESTVVMVTFIVLAYFLAGALVFHAMALLW